MLRRLLGRAHAFFLLLLREHTAPGRIALGVFVGCVVGCTPLFGLHLPLCVALALLLRLNKLVVYGAANLSVPPMVPILGLISVELGGYLLYGRPFGLSRAQFQGAAVHEIAARFFLAWLAGGVVLGAGIGAVGGAVVYGMLRRRAGRSATTSMSTSASASTGIDAAIERARRRYDGLRPWHRHYARAKYRMDPCYQAICARVPEGAFVVDLGTGLGMLPVLLGELSRTALGIEWDPAKVACGVHASQGLPGIEIVQGDIRTAALPACDVVTLVDVLHYYDAAGQRQLLARAVLALRPGGLLLIRDGDPERRGGAGVTRAIERLMVRLGWNRAPSVRFRKVAELCQDLTELGLLVERVDDVAGRLHPGNVLLCARKAPTA